MTPIRIRAAMVAWLAIALASPVTAQAQSEGRKAAAEALFQQARSLLEQQDYAGACAKLAASQKLEAAIGTLLFLGECNERLGNNASAWAAFLEAQSLAQRQGDGERERVATVRAAALEPVVSRLALRVVQPAAGLTIRRNGVELPKASWDTPLPVDPGEHRLEAVAPDMEPWVQVVTVAEGGVVQSVEVPPLVAVPVASPPPPPAATTPVETGPRAGGEGSSAGPPGMVITGLVAAGLGVVGLGFGTAFGVMAKGTNDESLDHCRTPTLCSPTGLELREDAQSEATLSTVFFVAGGLLAAGGLTVFLLSPSEPDVAGSAGASAGTATGVTLTASAAPGQSGLVLRGQW